MILWWLFNSLLCCCAMDRVETSQREMDENYRVESCEQRDCAAAVSSGSGNESSPTSCSLSLSSLLESSSSSTVCDETFSSSTLSCDDTDALEYAFSPVVNVGEQTLAQFSAMDLRDLSVAVAMGAVQTSVYLHRAAGSHLRVAWPPGWCLVIRSADDASRSAAEDVRRCEREYDCCDTGFCFLGCFLNMLDVSEPSDERPYVGLPAMMSAYGELFCYSGPREDVLYRVADSVEEFMTVGLRRVESVYGDPALVPLYMRDAYCGLLELDGVGDLHKIATVVIRRHGDVLPVAYPHGARLRVCSLKCFEASACCGVLMRMAREAICDEHTGLGIVYVNSDERYRRCDWSKNRIPIFVAAKGWIYACDVPNCEYVRLARSFTAFVNMGLRYFYEDLRFVRRGRTGGGHRVSIGRDMAMTPFPSVREDG